MLCTRNSVYMVLYREDYESNAHIYRVGTFFAYY